MGGFFHKIKSALVYIFIFCLFFSPNKVFCATLNFYPTTDSKELGDTFLVSVYVESAEQSINAVAASISFPQDKLEVISVSKEGSVFNLWVKDPAFSNSKGTISAEGVILDPGFKGTFGKIFTILFKAKVAGVASLIFSNGMILANDGEGTNIISGFGTATFNLGEIYKQAPESTLPAGVFTLPAPEIKSSSYPDPNFWYQNTEGIFNWDVVQNATKIRIVFDKFPQTIPFDSYDPVISEKKIENIADGIWYLHARFGNNEGWGSISHFRVQIDSQKPDLLDVLLNKNEDLTDPRISLFLNAHDEVSGISNYEVQIDGKKYNIDSNQEKVEYQTPPLSPGDHLIIVRVFDKAGNYISDSYEVNIAPIFPPQIEDYSKDIWSTEPIIIRGKSDYPSSQVMLWVQRENDSPEKFLVKVSDNGKFIFVGDNNLNPGVYSFWAESIDNRGAHSNATEKFNFVIKKAEFFKIVGIPFSLTYVILFFILLLVVISIFLYTCWRRCNKYKKEVNRKFEKTNITVRKTFEVLKEHIIDELDLKEGSIKNKKLSRKEKNTLVSLVSDLNDAEKFVENIIKDIFNKK